MYILKNQLQTARRICNLGTRHRVTYERINRYATDGVPDMIINVTRWTYSRRYEFVAIFPIVERYFEFPDRGRMARRLREMLSRSDFAVVSVAVVAVGTFVRICVLETEIVRFKRNTYTVVTT